MKKREVTLYRLLKPGIRDPGPIPIFRTHDFSTIGKNKNRQFGFLFFFHFWKKYGRRSRKPED